MVLRKLHHKPMNKKRKRIALFGATGSIGGTTLGVLRAFPGDFELVAAVVGRDCEGLANIAREFGIAHAGVFDETLYAKAKGLVPESVNVAAGASRVRELATLAEVDCVVMAIPGIHGILPTIEALKMGKTVALASKEVLVVAGKFVMDLVRNGKGQLLPIDSELNAIFQCLQGNSGGRTVEKLLLTASGGPFWNWPEEAFKNISVEDALKHPNFSMGKKITVDSATMANKGLELIETCCLFDKTREEVDVVVHPEQMIHSMVQFCDGSILGQMAPPSMVFPIEYCLFYPERGRILEKTIDFSRAQNWHFYPEDGQRFPCLRLAREAAKDLESTAPTVFNAANEVAVEAFFKRKITYLDIPKIIASALDGVDCGAVDTVEEVLNRDCQTRFFVQDKWHL
jgi:1-deoxy-D-xylulose-5-phosphate reductoisomerase